MNIVCLAWGSLIWNPGVVPVVGPWLTGGPSLPIEFCRVGDKGELATAPCPGAAATPVCWARLGVSVMNVARALLRQREEIPLERVDGIGSVIVGREPGPLVGALEILRWATNDEDIDAVIWTALPPRFDGIEGKVPTPAEAVNYLSGLEGDVRRHAEDYIRKVPAEFQTINRIALERFLTS